MINIAIVDDDDTDAANTTSLIGRYYESDRSAYHITRFTDGDTFLDTYRAGFDVLFLDIEMPGIDGLETAHRLREIDDHVMLVFTTKRPNTRPSDTTWTQSATSSNQSTTSASHSRCARWRTWWPSAKASPSH